MNNNKNNNAEMFDDNKLTYVEVDTKGQITQKYIYIFGIARGTTRNVHIVLSMFCPGAKLTTIINTEVICMFLCKHGDFDYIIRMCKN